MLWIHLRTVKPLVEVLLLTLVDNSLIHKHRAVDLREATTVVSNHIPRKEADTEGKVADMVVKADIRTQELTTGASKEDMEVNMEEDSKDIKAQVAVIHNTRITRPMRRRRIVCSLKSIFDFISVYLFLASSHQTSVVIHIVSENHLLDH